MTEEDSRQGQESSVIHEFDVTGSKPSTKITQSLPEAQTPFINLASVNVQALELTLGNITVFVAQAAQKTC